MGLFKKKMEHQVTDGDCQDHLNVMRANYRDNIITSKSLPKPLWLRLHKNDGLNVIYRDKDIVLSRGQVYYGAIVQANSMLFDKGNKMDLPANIIYSTHPFAEQCPALLGAIANELFAYKEMPADEVPEEFRKVAAVLAAETDRSGVDFTVSLPDPDDPDKLIQDIDVHFCSVIVFHKDLPDHVLQGSFVPVLAAPELTPAVLILPKEYWTAPYYELD